MSEKPNPLLTAVIDRLKQRGSRMTKTRKRILCALMTFDRPASAEEVRLRANLAATDLVTVYRNFEVLAEADVLQRVPLESGTYLFELTAPEEHYHHVVCRKCHKTERLDVCIGSQVEEVGRKHGFKELTHMLEVYGLCADCVAQAPAEKIEAAASDAA